MTWWLVALGGAVGAPARYLVDRLVQSRVEGAWPWGTFVVNVAGTLVLGALLGWPALPAETVAAVGTGFCGAFTTYSTLSYEVLVLGRTQRRRAALAYLLTTTASGLAAGAVGYGVVHALAGPG